MTMAQLEAILDPRHSGVVQGGRGASAANAVMRQHAQGTVPKVDRDRRLDEVLPFFDEEGRHVAPGADWSTRVIDESLPPDLRIALTSALDELPADYRSVVVLRDIEGLSNVEIAAALGLSVPNVKTRVHRARLFLRKRLTDTMMK